MDYKFLLDIGLIILVVKLFSILTQRIHMPRVLGGLIAGILLGPAALNIVHSSSVLETFSTLGVIFIMFLAGMETKLKIFLENKITYFKIAIVGIILPLVLGYLMSTFYFQDFKTNLFLGLLLTSTSISITVESLVQMKKSETKVGLAILGAGVVDDIIGIIFLSIILTGNHLSIPSVILSLSQITLFFIFACIIGFILYRIFQWLELSNKNNEKLPTFSLALALIFSFIAEKFGVSGIIGAYIAGLIIGNTKKGNTIKPQIEFIVSLLFAPIFSAILGLNLETLSFSFVGWIFIFTFTIIAILGKFIGNGIGARMCNFSKEDATTIGIGMAIRGEVALVMLDKALEINLISSELFSMLLVVIAIITFIAPILLEIRLKNYNIKEDEKTEITR